VRGSFLRPRKLITDPLVVMSTDDLRNYMLEIDSDGVRDAKQIWKGSAGRKNMVDFLGSDYTLDKLVYSETYLRGGNVRIRRLPYTSVKNDIIRFSSGVRVVQRGYTQGLINSTISAQDWYEQSLRTLKFTLWASFTIAEGGYNNFRSQEVVDRWIDIVSPVFYSFNSKAEDLKAGTRQVNGMLLNVADTLAESIVTTFEGFRLHWATRHGVPRARRRIHGGESCHDSGDRKGCVELAALGYQPTWKVVPIGMAACYHRCRCYLEYSYEPR
jgi:hypothetical protein